MFVLGFVFLTVVSVSDSAFPQEEMYRVVSVLALLDARREKAGEGAKA